MENLENLLIKISDVSTYTNHIPQLKPNQEFLHEV